MHLLLLLCVVLAFLGSIGAAFLAAIAGDIVGDIAAPFLSDLAAAFLAAFCSGSMRAVVFYAVFLLLFDAAVYYHPAVNLTNTMLLFPL